MTRFSATPSAPPTPPAAWRPTAVARTGFAPGPVARSGDSDQQPHGGLHASPPYAPIESPPPLPPPRSSRTPIRVRPAASTAARATPGQGTGGAGVGRAQGGPRSPPPFPTRIADSDIRRAVAGVAFGGGPGAVLRDVGRDAARPGPLLLFIYFLYLLSLLLYNDDVMIKNNNDK